MRYVVFSRVSTSMQDTENQLFEINAYLDSVIKEGDEVIRFDEKAQSTRLEMEDRPVLKAMLETIKKGDIVVIYKLNRLARGHELALIHHMITKKSKAQIVSLYEKDINDELIHAYAMVGAFERKNIRDNTITALKNKQSKMEKVGTVWYGYKTDETKLQKREKVRSTGKPYLLIPEESERAQVSLMVEMHRRGASYGEIVSELETRGFRNRKGNPVQKMTVWRVLNRLEKQHPTPVDSVSA
jgi:DNA invertase Pin-like site-specific DNA recombinase